MKMVIKERKKGKLYINIALFVSILIIGATFSSAIMNEKINKKEISFDEEISDDYFTSILKEIETYEYSQFENDIFYDQNMLTDDFGSEDLLKIIVTENSEGSDGGDDDGSNNGNAEWVDKIFEAKKCDRTVSGFVKVKSVPLNVIGHATVDVVTGEEVIEKDPIFNGFCVGDKIAFSIIALTLGYIIRTIVTLKLLSFTFKGAFNVAKGIAKGVLDAAKVAFNTGKIGFDLGKIPGFSIAGLTVWSTLPSNVKETIKHLTDMFIQGLIIAMEPFVEFLRNEYYLGYFFDKFSELIDDTIFEEIIEIIYNAGVNIVETFFTILIQIRELIEKNWDSIKSFLTQIGLTLSAIAWEIFRTFLYKIRDFTVSIFGHSEVFFTEGNSQIQLNNLFLQLKRSASSQNFTVKYYNENGELVYVDSIVSIIEVKCYSQEKQFSTEKIAIRFQCDDPGQDNLPPNNLNLISSTSSGKINTAYNFRFSSEDPEQNKIFYKINWGDEEEIQETELYESGEEVFISHIWEEEGEYKISVTAVDEYGYENDQPLLIGPITISSEQNKPSKERNQESNFLQDFPFIYQLLQYFLK